MTISTPTPDKFTGCLLGGAIGDALGEPIEFLTLAEIQTDYGKGGVIDYCNKDRKGIITDDTQMTLFTAEGLLQCNLHRKNAIGSIVNSIYRSYLRWYGTQGEISPLPEGIVVPQGGYLFQQPELFVQRSPGVTCLGALSSGKCGGFSGRYIINDSKGCGSIMRVAPVGLMYYKNPDFASLIGMLSGYITHGHMAAAYSAGVFAFIIAELIQGKPLRVAIEGVYENSSIVDSRAKEVWIALESALNAAEKGASPEILESLGGGWVADEALSIALYCALVHEDDFEKGVLLAVNHSGDSDSTGSLTGNLLGAIHGEKNLPKHLLENLELKNVVRQVATDLYTVSTTKRKYDPELVQRYTLVK